MRAVIYTRISKQDANVPKVENQLAQLRKLAQTAGYDVVATFTDDGISAFKVDVERPDFERLLAFIETGKCDVVLAMADDRLTRGGGLEALKFGAHCAKYGVKTHTDREGLRDPSDDMGELLTFLGGWKANQEVKAMVKRQRDANAALRAAGKPRKAGGRPFGYKADKVTINEVEADLIRQGTQMIVSGQPRWEVVNLFNNSGIKTVRGSYQWRSSTVFDLLKRARNAGLMEYQDEIVGEADWEAIVSVDDLKQVRDILSTPVRASSGKPAFTLLTNIAQCHCGEVMHAHATSEKGLRVYRCSTMDTIWDRTDFEGKHVAIKIDRLDLMVRAAITDAYTYQADKLGAKQDEANTIAELHKEIADLRERKTTLTDLLLAKQITRPEFNVRAAQIDAETSSAETRISQLASASAHTKLLLEAKEAFTVETKDNTGPAPTYGQMRRVEAKIGEVFDALPLDAKRAVIAASLEITVNPGHRWNADDRVSIERKDQWV